MEFQHEARGLILRIYIDKEGGVTLDDCTLISRQLSDLLDVHLTDSAPYSLEISSPGLDRPLAKPNYFQRFKGEMARIKTMEPVEGRKNFTGRLMGLKDGIVNLMTQDKAFLIPYTEIKKARLINYNGES